MFDNQLSYDEQLKRWSKLIAHWRWYPDAFCEVLRPIDPETGKRTGFDLTYDQRIYLRGVFRQGSSFICVSRGYGKTTLILLSLYLQAILYPGVTLKLGAQSQQGSANLFLEKHSELVNKMYPALANELKECFISKDKVKIVFKNGSMITNMGLNQGAKGSRAVGITVEECAVVLEDATVYHDAIAPILNTQYTSPKNQKPDLWYVNKECFVTTSYFRNNSFDFNINIFNKMINNDGGFVFGASYKLPALGGRGKSIEEYEKLKDETTEIFWQTNYCSRWITGNEHCIVDMEKLRATMTIPKPELKGDKNGEYFVSADIARSASDKNARTAIVVGKVKRNKDGRIRNVDIVNIISLPSGTPYQEQSLWLRRLQKMYNARACFVDANGVGSAIVDILLETQRDPITGEDYNAWDTLNSDIKSTSANAIPMVWSVYAQTHNHDFLVNFTACVSSGGLRLLDRIDSNRIIDAESHEILTSEVLPHIRTMQLIDEIGNLSLETTSSGKLKVKQNIRMTKDIFSALMYLIGGLYEDYNNKEEAEFDISDFFCYSAPKIR